MSLALSGLGSGAAKMRSSNSISAMVRSASIAPQYVPQRSEGQRGQQMTLVPWGPPPFVLLQRMGIRNHAPTGSGGVPLPAKGGNEKSCAEGVDPLCFESA